MATRSSGTSSLGNLKGSYSYLGVAPSGLKPLVMRGLNREIGRARAGEPAQVFMKMNSLTDRDVIDKISEACRAGVRVMLVIRGICCIKADIPHKTEGLIAHQIVGRFLEHARVYAFGVDTDILYLSSADMMTRNTERRVEIAYPVLDPECKERVIEFVNLQLADNVKARRLTREERGRSWPPRRTTPGSTRRSCCLQRRTSRPRSTRTPRLTPPSWRRRTRCLRRTQARRCRRCPRLAATRRTWTASRRSGPAS